MAQTDIKCCPSIKHECSTCRACSQMKIPCKSCPMCLSCVNCIKKECICCKTKK